MKNSFIDRLFPQPTTPLLPQHEHNQSARHSSRSSTLLPRVRSQDVLSRSIAEGFSRSVSHSSTSSAGLSPNVKSEVLSSAPLSASVLHHDDPFLPLERAARALQDSIQILLDAQSSALNGRIGGVDTDGVTSGGSLTPTQSIVTPKSSSGIRAIPIRQPTKKKIGLHGARKGLAKKMHEFAELKEQELQILDTESRARSTALQRVEDLEAKREACATEIQSIRREEASEVVLNLRAEARDVESEINELEHKLLELRVRHRHLLGQASQLESTLESKISSFQGTISMVDKEIREFLRRPPVSHALVDTAVAKQSGMYALKPERRTLNMAKEQWVSEQDLLTQRKLDVENEHVALLKGEHIWSQTMQYIDHFEQNLRQQIAQLNSVSGEEAQASMTVVLKELAAMIERLEADLAHAESNNWNLLICAIGAELEAFHQAREMLEETQRIATTTADRPHDDVFNQDLQPLDSSDRHLPPDPSTIIGSNESLKDTLKEFPSESKPASKMTTNPTRYESEDDEPPTDFFLSH